MEKYSTARQTTGDNTTRRMHFECRITKDTNAHSEYVALFAFPLQQWLRERASILTLYAHHASNCIEIVPQEDWRTDEECNACTITSIHCHWK